MKVAVASFSVYLLTVVLAGCCPSEGCAHRSPTVTAREEAKRGRSGASIARRRDHGVLRARGGAGYHEHNGDGSVLPRGARRPSTSSRSSPSVVSRSVATGAPLAVVGGTTTTTSQGSFLGIAYDELSKFASLSSMMFLFIYVFTTVRDTKDTLVVSNCGAESIPFLKLYVVTPTAILFILGYSHLSNSVGKKALFVLTLVPFFAFYTAFAFLLYPARHAIHGSVVDGSGPLQSLVTHWSYSLYFVVSELWASAGIPLLFWSCANDVTPMAQAKRFYPLFSVFGNLAPILSGKIMAFLVSLQASNDDNAFGQTLKLLAVVKLVAFCGMCLLHRTVYSLVQREATTTATTDSSSKPKHKVSLGDSVRELLKSRELRSIATMVLCYNVCIELTEVVWKALLRKVHTNKSDYMSYVAACSQIVGAVALLMQLSAPFVIARLGWMRTALVPPLSMSVLAVPFLACVARSGGLSPSLVLTLGTAQVLLSKATKYTLFDPCKEMAYIPLGPDAKGKGKAGVEVMGSRFGRGLGSAVQQLVVIGAGSVLEGAPVLGSLYVTAVWFWTRAVGSLGRLMTDADGDETEKTKK